MLTTSPAVFERFDPEAYTFPPSSLASDVMVEGVVARSDEHARRITELRKRKTNAELNETDPITIWEHLS